MKTPHQNTQDQPDSTITETSSIDGSNQQSSNLDDPRASEGKQRKILPDTIHNEAAKRIVARELALGVRPIAEIARLVGKSELTIKRWANEDSFVDKVRSDVEFKRLEATSRLQLKLYLDGEIFLDRMMSLGKQAGTGATVDPENGTVHKEHRDAFKALQWVCDRLMPYQQTSPSTAITTNTQVNIDASTQNQIGQLLASVRDKLTLPPQIATVVCDLDNDPHLQNARDVSYGISPATKTATTTGDSLDSTEFNEEA